MKVPFTEYAPNIVGIGRPVSLPQPSPYFEGGLRDLFSAIYSVPDMVGYNPIIIGYDHTDTTAVPMVTSFIGEVRLQSASCHVAIELSPDSFRWIQEFRDDERQFFATGMIRGKKPSVETVAGLTEYRRKLANGFGSSLALWLLENNVPTLVIEHPEVRSWIIQDAVAARHGPFAGIPWGHLWPFYTAISRDIYGLHIMAEAKPDVICVGAYHAPKYDFLLQRDGRNTCYFFEPQFLERQFTWEVIRRMWKAAHEAYKQYPPER